MLLKCAAGICVILIISCGSSFGQQSFSTNSKYDVVDTAKEKSPSLCIFCRLLLDTLMGLVTTPSNQDEIIGALDVVCNLLPAAVQSICTNFVTENIEAILDAIAASFGDPENACFLLNLCP